MIYVDSNVPMYLTGAEHPNKARVIELTAQLLSARERLITSAEAFQEIIHRYLSLKNQQHLNAAYEALEAMVSTVVDVTKKDADQARWFSGVYAGLSSRDCIHAAVIHRLDCEKIWSYDAGFNAIAWVQRIA